MTRKVENQVYILMSVMRTTITIIVISIAIASEKMAKSPGVPSGPMIEVDPRL